MKVGQQYAESIRQPLNNRMKNYTGKQKGMLLLLWPTTERMSHSGVKWAAKCQCGNYAIVLPCSSGTCSCGCHRVSVSTESGRSKRKLSDEQVRKIKSDNRPAKLLAYALGVHLSAIYNVRSGRRYADVK